MRDYNFSNDKFEFKDLSQLIKIASLQELSLSCEQFKQDEWKILADCISENKSLVKLKLTEVDRTFEEDAEFLKAIASHRSLRELSISLKDGININVIIPFIFPAIKDSSIQIVELLPVIRQQEHCINDNSLKKVIELLSSNATLTSLTLCNKYGIFSIHPKLSLTLLSDLQSVIELNKTLTFIEFGLSRFSYPKEDRENIGKQIDSLCAALEANKNNFASNSRSPTQFFIKLPENNIDPDLQGFLGNSENLKKSWNCINPILSSRAKARDLVFCF